MFTTITFTTIVFIITLLPTIFKIAT
jgi:hypothetical protein